MSLILNIGAIFIFSCLFECSSFDYQSPVYIKLAHEITEKTGNELKEQKNLYLVGTGGRMMDDIQMMAMSFDYYQEVNLETARELIVYSIKEYLSAINSNMEIRPYLHEYPFTAKNVKITIFFFNSNRSSLPLEKIECVASVNSKLRYYIGSNYHQPICEENYEEILQKTISNQE